jgi:hypothetical protein
MAIGEESVVKQHGDRRGFGRLARGGPAETIRFGLSIHRAVIEESVAWIAASPATEVGGKYVGRIHGALAARSADWRRQLASVRLEIIHHLDAGPGAERTATYHLPDGYYQESLFRAIEARHRDVRHLGSWHSHHPNGFNMLSEGDIRGYLRDVNSPQHSHDFFVASLAIDGHGLGRARHFLFIRGQREFFEIDPRSVHIDGGPNPYSVVAVLRRATGPERQGDGHGTADSAMSRGNGAEPVSADSAAPPGARKAATAIPEWATRKAGQAALSADRAWICDVYPELRLVSRGGLLLWTGAVRYKEMTMSVTMAYPDDYPASTPIAEIAGRMAGLEVKVQAILRPRTAGDDYRTQLFLLMKRAYEINRPRKGRTERPAGTGAASG